MEINRVLIAVAILSGSSFGLSGNAEASESRAADVLVPLVATTLIATQGDRVEYVHYRGRSHRHRHYRYRHYYPRSRYTGRYGRDRYGRHYRVYRYYDGYRYRYFRRYY